MPQPIAPSAPHRLVLSLTAALFAVLMAASPAAADEPDDWLLDADRSDLRVEPVHEAVAPEPVPDLPSANPTPSPPTQTPTPTPTPSPSVAPDPIGYDVSYPQCGRSYPESFAFAIVGVNGGRVYDVNPCLGPGEDASQLEWAGEEVELYFNTGNPGPRLSEYWPNGQTEPRECDTADNPGTDTVDCAYVYGWNAAEHGYAAALEAFVELGWTDADAEHLPGEVTIWLDVEPANSWRGDRDLNVAALEGAVGYLQSVEVDRIGFYSAPRLWQRITGGTDAFADHPAWHAGADDRDDAERRCTDEEAFTGGELAMVQWVAGDIDANVRCDEVAESD